MAGNNFNPDEYLNGSVTTTVKKPAPQPLLPPPQTSGGFDADAYLSKEFSPSKTSIDLLSKVGERLDSVTGAPTRAAVGTYLDTRSAGKAMASAARQFGGPAEKAPTGEELANKMGFSGDIELPITGTKISRPKTVGVVLDVGLDPTNLPLAAMAKLGLRTAEGVGMGANITARVVGAGDAAKAVRSSWQSAKRLADQIINPRYAADWEKAAAVATKHGIDPDMLSNAIRFGPDSYLSRKTRAMAEGVDAARLEKHNQGFAQISNALENFNSEKVGRGLGKHTKEEAGQIIRQAYNKAVDDTFNMLDVTYTNAAQKSGITSISEGAKKSALEQMEDLYKAASWKAERGATKDTMAQGRFVKSQLEKIADSIQHGDYDEVVRHLRDIGTASYKTANDIGWDQKSGQEIYRILQNSIYDTVGQANPEVLKSLKETNQTLSAFMNNQSVVQGVLLDAKKGGEKVFQELVESGGSVKLDALKEILGADSDAMAVAKSTWLDTIKTANKDGIMDLPGIARTLRTPKGELITGRLFTPEELQSLAEITSLGEHHGLAIMSTSGTGASNSLSNVFSSLKNQTADNGFVEYLTKKADAAKNKGKTAPISRFGGAPGAMAVPYYSKQATIGDEIADVARSLYPNVPSASELSRKAFTKGSKAYSVQDSPIRRRLNKDKK